MIKSLNIQLVVRLTKVLLVFFAAVFGFLVFFGNITDYNSNYQFVRHVLLMDTIFEGNKLMYRSIESELIHKLGYAGIIVLEGLFSLFCFIGAYKMCKNINASSEEFHASKMFAIIGVLTGLTVWFFGFQVVGGEWFAMWQSKTWNGLGSASRFVTFLFPLLIYVSLKNDD